MFSSISTRGRTGFLFLPSTEVSKTRRIPYPCVFVCVCVSFQLCRHASSAAPLAANHWLSPSSLTPSMLLTSTSNSLHKASSTICLNSASPPWLPRSTIRPGGFSCNRSTCAMLSWTWAQNLARGMSYMGRCHQPSSARVRRLIMCACGE